MHCGGWVRTLKGQTLCFTGAALIDGVRKVRRDCVALAKKRGAETKTDFSRSVSVVVHGDLASKFVTDSNREYSRTLIRTAAERARKHHVCVVDANGFADLVNLVPARCRNLRRATGDNERVLVLPQTGDGILGGLLLPRKPGRHDGVVAKVDLDQLDRGTAAHEATIAALTAHLAAQNIDACGHFRHAPRFDVGWARDKALFIAEVKSLTDANEDQQIRLGIGQILDYAHQLHLTDASAK